jgi:hypothetical protein
MEGSEEISRNVYLRNRRKDVLYCTEVRSAIEK